MLSTLLLAWIGSSGLASAGPERIAIVPMHDNMDDVVGILEHEANEGERFTVQSRETVASALVVLKRSNIDCVFDDESCWARFAVGAGFQVIAVVDADAENLSLLLVDARGTRRGKVQRALDADRAAIAREAWSEIFGGARSPPRPPPPVVAASPPVVSEPRPPTSAPTLPSEKPARRVPWIAAVGGAVLVGCGAGAAIVSAVMDNQLNDAALRKNPLPGGYDAESALFWTLAAGAGVGAVAGGTGLVVWLATDE